MLVTITGTVSEETLPVDVSIRQVSEKKHGNAMQGMGEESQYKFTRALTIWLSLHGNSGGGDDCRRSDSRKEGQSRTRNADSHGRSGGGRASEVVTIKCREGNYTEKQVEEKRIK